MVSRIGRRSRGAGIVLGTALLLGPMSSAGAAPSTSGHFGSLETVPHGSAISSRNEKAVLCEFLQYGDNPHISSSAPRTVSSHGWWENVNCKATKAVVTIQLQRKNSLGLWFDVGTEGKKTVYSGGGSANRANSRYLCSGTARNEFRAWVDVDVLGVADLPNRTYSSAFTILCG